MNSHEIAAADMDGSMCGHHLQFHADSPEVFDRTRGARATIADGGEWLAVPFLIGLIERVLQSRCYLMVVFGDHEDIAVETADGFLPADRFGILARHPQV